MKYLSNGLSPNMFSFQKGKVTVKIEHINVNEFCTNIKDAVNTIGHQSTADLINSLCGTSLKMNRITFTASKGDEIYVITLTIRLEEGKVLSADEIAELMNQGKIKFMRAVIVE